MPCHMEALVFACPFLVVAASVPVSRGGVIFQDTFDAYADQAAVAQVWVAEGTPAYFLDSAVGHPGQSIQLPPGPSVSGATNRWYHDLGDTFHGTDEQPLVLSFDLRLGDAGIQTGWRTTVSLVDMRGYTGGGYKQGSLRDLVAVGLSNLGGAGPLDTRFFQARIYQAGAPGIPGSLGYMDLSLPGAPGRSSGWHRLRAVATTSLLDFYVDDVRAGSLYGGLPYGINTLVLGDGYDRDDSTTWVDNVRLEVLPEPTGRSLLLGAVLFWFTRRSHNSRRLTSPTVPT